MKNTFEIDFFELSFLTTACIPPTPIARAAFWDKLINEYYDQLDQQQRDNLFEWVNREPSMEFGLDKGNKECLLFNARFDKDNQYIVETLYNGKKETHETFLHDGRYRINKNTDVNPKYIKKIDKITF